MLEVAFVADRHLREPQEAPQTVPHIDVCPRHPLVHTAPEDDGATALRNRRIAKYGARLRKNQAQAPVALEVGYEDPQPATTTGTGLLRVAGHGYLLHPGRVSRPTQLAAITVDSPWARHQQRAHRLSNGHSRSASGTRYGVHGQDWVAEPFGPGMAHKPAPQPRYQGSMEMPDSPSEGEEADEGYVGYPPLPQGMRAQPLPPRYGGINRSGERLSWRNWYEIP